jgi:hypothetical protein
VVPRKTKEHRILEGGDLFENGHLEDRGAGRTLKEILFREIVKMGNERKFLRILPYDGLWH